MMELSPPEIAPMDPSEIYAKTDLGLQELKERKLNLPITLRGLLILIDGNRTSPSLKVVTRTASPPSSGTRQMFDWALSSRSLTK